jgi:hypothetical protein
VTWQEDLRQLIFTGQFQSAAEGVEERITGAIALLRQGIQEDGALVVETLHQSYKRGTCGMIPITLTLMLTQLSSEQWSQLQPSIKSLLFQLDAKTLCELTTLLRNKTFGVGLGSRMQKLIRQAMETWTSEHLEFYITAQNRYLYSLLRLIHPRYDQKRSKIIRLWLYDNS